MKRWLPFCLVLAFVSCDRTKVAASADDGTGGKAKPREETSAGPAAGIKSEAPGEEPVVANERVRALPRPPDKIHPKPTEVSHPFAEAVKDKPGYVVSPFNGKIIDARDIPSGTLVQDPSAPQGSKSYFRVP